VVLGKNGNGNRFISWEWVEVGMGMVLWEWEGMGTEIVLPAHLYCTCIMSHIAFVRVAHAVKNVKVCIYLFMGTRHKVTERQLPHGITQYYLSPDTGERAPRDSTLESI